MKTLPGMDGVMSPVDEAQLRSEEARRVFEANEAAAPWLDDYWALLAEGWPWRQAVYLMWAAQPKETRWPRTQGELATAVLGLTSDRVIRDWKADNPAMEVRIAKLAASTLSKARAEIYAALIQAASNPNPRAHSDRRLALEMMGDYVPKQRVDLGTVTDDLSEMSTEELMAMAQVAKVRDGDGAELDAVLQWKDLVQEIVEPHNIEPAVILAMIWVESRGDPDVVNSKSRATGLMQVMPREVKGFEERPSIEELKDPRINIEWGIKILVYYLKKSEGLWEALYKYSGGTCWESQERFTERYWEPFVNIRQKIRAAMEERVDAG